MRLGNSYARSMTLSPSNLPLFTVSIATVVYSWPKTCTTAILSRTGNTHDSLTQLDCSISCGPAAHRDLQSIVRHDPCSIGRRKRRMTSSRSKNVDEGFRVGEKAMDRVVTVSPPFAQYGEQLGSAIISVFLLTYSYAEISLRSSVFFLLLWVLTCCELELLLTGSLRGRLVSFVPETLDVVFNMYQNLNYRRRRKGAAIIV